MKTHTHTPLTARQVFLYQTQRNLMFPLISQNSKIGSFLTGVLNHYHKTKNLILSITEVIDPEFVSFRSRAVNTHFFC